MKVSSVHRALRVATAQRHESLDTDADVEARLRDPERRVAVMTGLRDFHRHAEAMAAPFASLFRTAGVDPEGRSAALDRGLSQLRGDAAAPAGEASPAGLSTALGWAYVAEGSALGGRVMRKAMVRDGIDLTGLDFLDPHGDETGPRWLRFLALLDAAVSDGRADLDAVLGAAVDAFDRARAALVPASTVSRAA